ncbi:AMP-binding protein [Gordonia sp. NPDC003376]
MSGHSSIYGLFADRATTFRDHPVLAVPRRLCGEWGFPAETTYADALDQVDALASAYAHRGYGNGDIIALAFDSRPQHLLHHLALNSIGTCTVPLNTDLTAPELAYVLDHSGACATVCLDTLRDIVGAAAAMTDRDLPVAGGPEDLPDASANRARHSTNDMDPIRHPAAILYTSGTTGRPKGCVIDNLYALESGRNYGTSTEALTLRPGADRVFNPLPLYHMNSLMLTFGGVVDRGACLVVPGRFSLSNWWDDIRETGATRFHYLGIMIPALMTAVASPEDRKHSVRSAFGAGVDPVVHGAFEERFGIPLHEVWGMTETGRGLLVADEPRQISTRACGRPMGIEARIAREDGSTADDGELGELVVRDSAEDPRRGFFTGYLHDPDATETAWLGGWFHTGDLCRRDASGMFYFVDRAKNIIRRSGENISSAEVEAVLTEDARVSQAVVLAVPDAMRDEEVLAVIVPHDDSADELVARSICLAAREQLAYYKIPGWIRFVATLPTTGTQKVQKHLLTPAGFDGSAPVPGLHDCRDLKKRSLVPTRKES